MSLKDNDSKVIKRNELNHLRGKKMLDEKRSEPWKEPWESSPHQLREGELKEDVDKEQVARYKEIQGKVFSWRSVR